RPRQPHPPLPGAAVGAGETPGAWRAGSIRGAPVASRPRARAAAILGAMSHADVELVRRVFDAYLSGDEEATFELLAPDVAVTQFPDQVDGRNYHGHDGVRAVMAEWIGSWDDWSIELLEAWEVGELVFVRAFQQGRG